MKLPSKRAMSSEFASEVNRSGHIKEKHFAKIIGGNTQTGSITSKADVIDNKNRKYSVKSGKFWQIFLYGSKRLETNTAWKDIGNLSESMTSCLNVFPEIFQDYQINKTDSKIDLQPLMQNLLNELEVQETFCEFLEKSIFNGESVDYLAINRESRKSTAKDGVFHVFHKDDVISTIFEDISLANSKARTVKQMDDQKVVLVSAFHGKNVGDIEVRNDSAKHYRRLLFRLNGELVTDLLVEKIQTPEPEMSIPQLVIYGNAIDKLSNDYKNENGNDKRNKNQNDEKNENENDKKNKNENKNDDDYENDNNGCNFSPSFM